jgi:O-antigen ligase
LFLGLRLSNARSWTALGLLLPLVILLVGLLLSFSRGAWGSLVLASLIFFGLTLATSKSPRQSVRLIIFAACMVLLVMIVLAAAISMPKVAVLFTERATLVQDYDAGQGGRFDSQLHALKAIVANPLGIGPSQWGLINRLDTHNVYLNIGVAGGFLSGFAFIGFVLTTVWRGAKACLVEMPGQDLLIVAYACTVAHFVEAIIIDVDNWRHLFLLMGMSWGGILAANLARKLHRDERSQTSLYYPAQRLPDGFPS